MHSFASKIDPTQLGAASCGAHVENPTLTFAELLAAYCAQANPNEPRDYRLRKWKGWFGSRLAWTLTEGDFIAALDALLQAGMAPSTRNRELGDLKAIYNWAIREKRRSGVPKGFESPLSNVRKLPEQTRRVHVPEERINTLLALARVSPYRRMYGLILTALASGARRNELRRMRWDNTDLQRGLAEIGTDFKTGRNRTLILSSEVTAELSKYKKHQPDALVFCGTDSYAPYDERREWYRLRKEAGLPELHFHDLRHIAAARMLKAGASTLAASQVLGHADTRMIARRYGSLETNELKTVVSRAAEGLK
jgi:integrase